jgi:hypothetical protein
MSARADIRQEQTRREAETQRHGPPLANRGEAAGLPEIPLRWDGPSCPHRPIGLSRASLSHDVPIGAVPMGDNVAIGRAARRGGGLRNCPTTSYSSVLIDIQELEQFSSGA